MCGILAVINAQSGKLGHLENWLAGSLTVDGEVYTLPLEGKDPLFDPEYDPATHYEFNL